MKTDKTLGIYIHIPFCTRKCPYCDFYSLESNENHMNEFSSALCDEIISLHRSRPFVNETIKKRPVDSIYFGGGTPSVLGAKRISYILSTLNQEFNISNTVEITVECNPSSVFDNFFLELAASGVNRISLGLQSAIDEERQSLGRSSPVSHIRQAVKAAKMAGIINISLDLMLGIPHGSEDNLRKSAEFCLSLDIPHISAYMLKIEEGTPFSRNTAALNLPNDDELSDMYLFLCDYLVSNGLAQYEISNFSKEGFHSLHNLKYWNCEEYLGLGPSAHSFISGKRFYQNKDLRDFLKGEVGVFDSEGGSFSEYAMLRLRLFEGLNEKLVQKRFGHSITPVMYEAATIFEKNKLLLADKEGIRLNSRGFLLSNTIINQLLDSLD